MSQGPTRSATATTTRAAIRTMIVDDMPAMRTILRDMLEQLGFKEILEAEDGDAAWQQIKADAAASDRAFGLVISDWNMPGMSGVELLRLMRSFDATSELPFLMITGEGDRDHISEAVNAGATDFVIKPFNVEQLSEKIDGLFNQSN